MVCSSDIVESSGKEFSSEGAGNAICKAMILDEDGAALTVSDMLRLTQNSY
jgi:hypothetical protein